MSLEFWAAAPSKEYLAALDAFETAGFQAGVNSQRPSIAGVYGMKRTMYFQGYKQGKTQAQALVAA
jgi:hypothetical protein